MCVRVCVCACVRACVRARVRVCTCCVRACVCIVIDPEMRRSSTHSSHESRMRIHKCAPCVLQQRAPCGIGHVTCIVLLDTMHLPPPYVALLESSRSLGSSSGRLLILGQSAGSGIPNMSISCLQTVSISRAVSISYLQTVSIS